MGEFDLITRYFKQPAAAQTVALSGQQIGIGDDCAVFTPTPGMQLCVSSDMLVEGRHFLSTVSPRALGHKALAVNLSDLAACGARPVGFTLALAMPRVDEAWLAGFSQGLFELANLHGCPLIGGDTTQGPLNICITVLGEVPQGAALLRSGARVGDDVYVSGTATDHVGQARLALEVFRGTVAVDEAVFAHARQRMEMPTPRVALGMALSGVASSAVDVSDGLLGDLGHVLRASGVGADIDTSFTQQFIANYDHMALTSGKILQKYALEWCLAGGDDYELVFTAPQAIRAQVQAIAAQTQTTLTRIGSTSATPGLRLRDAAGALLQDAQGQPLAQTFAAFDHFA
jgi:thiamine-monophosphate kinase